MIQEALKDIVNSLKISKENYNISGNRLIISINNNIQLTIQFKSNTPYSTILNLLEFTVTLKNNGNILDTDIINLRHTDDIILCTQKHTNYPNSYGWVTKITNNPNIKYLFGESIGEPGNINNLSDYLSSTIEQLTNLIEFYKHNF